MRCCLNYKASGHPRAVLCRCSRAEPRPGGGCHRRRNTVQRRYAPLCCSTRVPGACLRSGWQSNEAGRSFVDMATWAEPAVSARVHCIVRAAAWTVYGAAANNATSSITDKLPQACRAIRNVSLGLSKFGCQVYYSQSVSACCKLWPEPGILAELGTAGCQVVSLLCGRFCQAVFWL